MNKEIGHFLTGGRDEVAEAMKLKGSRKGPSALNTSSASASTAALGRSSKQQAVGRSGKKASEGVGSREGKAGGGGTGKAAQVVSKKKARKTAEGAAVKRKLKGKGRATEKEIGSARESPLNSSGDSALDGEIERIQQAISEVRSRQAGDNRQQHPPVQEFTFAKDQLRAELLAEISKEQQALQAEEAGTMYMSSPEGSPIQEQSEPPSPVATTQPIGRVESGQRHVSYTYYRQTPTDHEDSPGPPPRVRQVSESSKRESTSNGSRSDSSFRTERSQPKGQQPQSRRESRGSEAPTRQWGLRSVLTPDAEADRSAVRRPQPRTSSGEGNDDIGVQLGGSAAASTTRARTRYGSHSSWQVENRTVDMQASTRETDSIDTSPEPTPPRRSTSRLASERQSPAFSEDPRRLRESLRVYFSEPEEDEAEEEPAQTEDEAEWRHEITMLRKEVGKALGDVDDARSAAIAAEEEVDFLRQSITSSPAGSPGVRDPRLASSRPGGQQGVSLGDFDERLERTNEPTRNSEVGTDFLAELRRNINDLPDVSTLSPPPDAVASMVPSHEQPTLTNAELRVAELERSLRIMQESTSKQTNVMAAIGIRAAMNERLMDPATYAPGFRDERRSGQTGRRGRRARSMSPSPYRSPPRHNPRSTNPSPVRNRRVASPSRWRPPNRSSTLTRTRSGCSPPPRWKSAGRNVGRVKRSGLKKQSLKELRLARKEITALRHDLSTRTSTGTSEQEALRKAAEMASAIQSMVGPAARDAVAEIRREVSELRANLGKKEESKASSPKRRSSSSLGDHRRQPSTGRRSHGGESPQRARTREPSLADGFSSPPRRGDSTAGRRRVPAPASHRRQGSQGSQSQYRDSFSAGASHAQEFEFPVDASSDELPEASIREGPRSLPDESYDGLEMKLRSSADGVVLSGSGRLRRLFAILEEVRKRSSSSASSSRLLDDALSLCEEEVSEADRKKSQLATLQRELQRQSDSDYQQIVQLEGEVQGLRAALQEAEEGREASKRAAAANAREELEEARAELQKAHNAVSAEAQAVEKLEEEKQRMEATIAELKAAQTEVASSNSEAAADNMRLQTELAREQQKVKDAEALHRAAKEISEALQQKLDASGVRHRNLEAELEEQDEKMRQMQSKLAKKEREVFRLATDAEEFGQQARELAHELDDTKRELLDKTTEALIEKKRSEELQAKRKTTDAELKRMAEEVEAQREELLELRMSAAARVEGRQAERQEEREYRFGEEEVEGELRAEVENLRAELKATKELLQGRVQQVEELRHELQAAGGLKNWRHEELLAQKEAELAAAKAEVVELRTQLARGGVKKASQWDEFEDGMEEAKGEEEYEAVKGGQRSKRGSRSRRSSGGSGDGVAAYAEGVSAGGGGGGGGGSQSYVQAMSRSAGRREGLLSLEDIASAASPYDFESPSGAGGGGRPPKARYQSHAGDPPLNEPIQLSRSSSLGGGNKGNRSPANSPRGAAAGRSPRNARNNSEPASPRGSGAGAGSGDLQRRETISSFSGAPPSREADAGGGNAIAKQSKTPKLALSAYTSAAQEKQWSAPAGGVRRWSGSGEGGSSSSEEDEDERSYRPRTVISTGSSPGQDLDELRRRLQSFKADTAVSILGKSQAVKQQLRRLHSAK